MENLKNLPTFEKFLNKKILSIDYGTKVTGTALFHVGRDPFPLPLKAIIYINDKKLADEIDHIKNEEFFDIIVLGVPYFTDGTSSKMTKRVLAFGKLIHEIFSDLEIYIQDETLSTEEAKERMRSGAQYNFKVDLKEIDKVAATIILEDFINNNIPQLLKDVD